MNVALCVDTCLVGIVLGFLSGACQPQGAAPEPLPTPDAMAFRDQVYPVLLRDCAFNRVCHGDPERLFHVLGPGRARIEPMLKPDEPATPLELQISYERARSMLLTPDAITRAPLLVKPLEPSAGGVGHKGVDGYGKNIYASPQAENYQVLLRWALGQVAPTARTTGAP